MTVYERLLYAAEKWKLVNISVLYEKETKAVYCAESAEWGNVILKINADKKELVREFIMLDALGGTVCCKVYAIDKNYGIIAEEQLYPGNTLRKEKDCFKRIKYFCTVFHNIHKTTIAGIQYGTYLEWLQKADVFCQENIAEYEIRKHMHSAYQIGEKLFKKYPERILLHGDLHHDNILQNGRDSYCIIDPKGIIGPEIFDTPRFILNEFDFVEAVHAEEHLEMIIRRISRMTGYCISDLTELLFMETMLANIWRAEDGEPLLFYQIETAADMVRHLK